MTESHNEDLHATVLGKYMNSQWYAMQSHSINRTHSHTKVFSPGSEQSVRKQTISSSLLEEKYHQIKVKALANLIWILHSRRTKGFRVSVPKHVAHQ